MEFERGVAGRIFIVCKNIAHPLQLIIKCLTVTLILHREDISTVLATDIIDLAREDVVRLVDKGYMVANLLDRRHIMGRKYHRCTLILQSQNLLFQEVGVDRVETRERLVENEQFGLMKHRNDKLNLLRHTLRQILDLLVPPLLDAEAHKPLTQTEQCLVAFQAFELCEEESLLAHLHLAIESSLLGEVANAEDILLCDGATIKENSALIGEGYAVDCADKRSLTCAIWSQQAIDRASRYLDRYIVECGVCRKAFCDMFGGNNIAHTPKNL